jgi:hypothetical protein
MEGDSGMDGLNRLIMRGFVVALNLHLALLANPASRIRRPIRRRLNVRSLPMQSTVAQYQREPE